MKRVENVRRPLSCMIPDPPRNDTPAAASLRDDEESELESGIMQHKSRTILKKESVDLSMLRLSVQTIHC